MRDIDDGDAVLPQLPDQLEQLADIGLLQRLGRLVEKKNPGLGGKSARDLDDMPLRQREFRDAPMTGMRNSSVAIRARMRSTSLAGGAGKTGPS